MMVVKEEPVVGEEEELNSNEYFQLDREQIRLRTEVGQ